MGGGAASSIVMATVLMGWFGLGWRTALVWMMVPGLLLAVSIWLYFRSSPDEDPQCDASERELIQGNQPLSAADRDVMPLAAAIGSVSLWLLVIQQFLNAGADVVYTIVLGSYFDSLGVGTETLGFLVSLPLFGGAFGGVAGGLLNDWAIRLLGGTRWARPLVSCSGKCIAAIVLLVAIQQSAPLTIAIGLFLVKFFTDWTQPTVWGTCTDLGGKYSATVFSINNTSGNCGAIFTPLIIGPLLDHFTRTTAAGEMQTNYTPMFFLVAGMYVACGLIWLFIDSSKQIRPAKRVRPTNGNEPS